MPELPEVEVLRRSLDPLITGAVIRRTRVWDGRLREPVDAPRLRKAGTGRRIESVRRRAKYLLLDMEGGHTLVIHLGMSGRVTLVPPGTPREAHEHVAWYLDSGKRLRLTDPRRFGLTLALETAALERDRHFAHLGLEPLGNGGSEGGGLSGEILAGLAEGRRGPVKTFLMDGRLVVGVGNIYASEALHRARIHPRRSVARIGRTRWDALACEVRQTLSEAIDDGGTTLNDFADGEGRNGYFQVSLAVYGREGEPCGNCGRSIRRLVQGGRSTFYCPGCQH